MEKNESPPTPNEPICLISFEITALLLGGSPENRMSFWKAYRREQELNVKTGFDNYHVKLCRQHLLDLKLDLKRPFFYRDGRLTTERAVEPKTPDTLH